MSIVSLVTAPALEPVTLTEAKAHLRLEHADDDTAVTSLITAARQIIEEHCWRGLVTQTVELVLEAFPACGWVELPRGHLASIASVKYIDGDGVEQTLATDQYEADSDSVPGKLRLAYDVSWPTTRCQWDAVRVRYVVGWAVADVPGPLKAAILLTISDLYENRGSVVVGTIASALPITADRLAAPYRLARF